MIDTVAENAAIHAAVHTAPGELAFGALAEVLEIQDVESEIARMVAEARRKPLPARLRWLQQVALACHSASTQLGWNGRTASTY